MWDTPHHMYVWNISWISQDWGKPCRLQAFVMQRARWWNMFTVELSSGSEWHRVSPEIFSPFNLGTALEILFPYIFNWAWYYLWYKIHPIFRNGKAMACRHQLCHILFILWENMKMSLGRLFYSQKRFWNKGKKNSEEEKMKAIIRMKPQIASVLTQMSFLLVYFSAPYLEHKWAVDLM